jgi:succinate dehydrogenase/fumarate reductase flavoprotein subunit
MTRPISNVNDTYDLIVLGAGGAGLTTALFGRLCGLRPLVIEGTEYIGGTTALSAGSAWIPNTDAGRKVNPSDTSVKALAYLKTAVADEAAEALLQRFVELGPEAVATLDRSSKVKLRAYEYHPDYLSHLEGATACGRVLEPVPFDGRQLGPALELIRPPIPEFTLFGGMMVDRTDIRHLLQSRRSIASLRHGIRLLTHHISDSIRGHRSSRLVMGNALIGRLLASLNERDVPIWCQSDVTDLLLDKSRVAGVNIRRGGAKMNIMARAGVVLAGGGFNRHPELRSKLMPDVPSFSPTAPGNTGRLIELALTLGASLGDEGQGHAFWAPVSVRTRKDGSQAVFPHFVLDRAKPGTLVVDQTGHRFLNESTSYNLFAKAMIAAHARRPSIPAYLIADRRALLAYGLGIVRPGGWRLRPFIDDNYLATAPTLRGLADALRVDGAALESTVSRMNAFARTGRDEDFGRGTTVYERNLGDPAILPNPTLGPVQTPPFYAVRLYPGDIAASTGLVTDADAGVLGKAGRIPGLFAVGNDMHSIMRGAYPGPGVTIGPALVFAYAAAKAASHDVSASREQTVGPQRGAA